MKETLKIFTSDFLPSEISVGPTFLEGKQTYVTTLPVSVGKTRELLEKIADAHSGKHPMVLEFFDLHGQTHETPILFAHALDVHTDPYPHESIAVYVHLTAEQYMALTPSDTGSDFGY